MARRVAGQDGTPGRESALLLRSASAAVSAAAFVAAFPPFDLGGLAWVALVPLLAAADRLPPRGAFWLGYAWGVVALGGELWWLTTFGAAVWVLGAALLGVFPALTLGAAAWIRRGREGPLDALMLAALWTAVEFLRGLGPLGFPWALLGESQHGALVVSQIASIVGVYGVSFLVALVNAALAACLTRSRPFIPLALAAACVVATLVWGTAVLRQPVIPTDGRGAFIAAVVQPNYAVRLTWDQDRAARDLDTLERLTHEAASRGASLIVWPETASPTDVPGDPATRARISAWARHDHVSLITSSLEGGQTNSAFSFAPDGLLTGRYDKRRLVPFSEFGERAGVHPGVLPTPRGGVGVTICFESTFPELSRDSVAAGAGLLAVITNDAWFDGRVAPAQHAAIAPFRAIEEGRFLLRSANSGESMIIDPHGRVLAGLPLGARGVLAAQVAARGDLTPFARYGYLFGWTAVLAAGAALLPRALSAVDPVRAPAFRRLLTVSLIPLAAVLATSGLHACRWIRGCAFTQGVGEAALSLPVLTVLAATVVLSLKSRGLDLGLRFRPAAFAAALVAGLAVVAGLAAMAVRGFSAHGTAPVPAAPPGGWVLGTAVQIVLVGLTLEWWLRGLVFAAASAWRGWPAAVVWAALLGAAAAAPRGAEAMVWGLASGVAFGLIRARWPQVPALAIAHGVGNVLLGFMLPPW